MSNEFSNKKKLPLFHLAERYPDVISFLNTPEIEAKKFPDNSIIVLDTNVLLLPYKTSKESLDKIKEVYSKLIEEKRLYVPEQAIREYINNKFNEIERMLNSINSAKENTKNLELKGFPLVKSLKKYEKLIELQSQINEQLKEYRKIVTNILDEIGSWQNNDPVSDIYRDLFKSEMIVNSGLSNEKIEEDFRRRSTNEIPPGYSDTEKRDGGIGDIIIWLTILGLGRKYKKNLIFITAEKKKDWWEMCNNNPISPRLELINEYSRNSDQHTFAILELSDLLQKFDTDKKIVEEVKLEEQKDFANYFISSIVKGELVKGVNPAIERWLLTTFRPEAIQYGIPSDNYDFILVLRSQTRMYGNVKEVDFGSFYSLSGYLEKEVIEFFADSNITNLIILLAINEVEAIKIRNAILDRIIQLPKFLNFALGYIKNSEFYSLYIYLIEDYAVQE